MTETAEALQGETGQVTELLTVTSRLIGVLEREIEMLRAMKPSEMQALQEEKIVLAAAYEARLKEFRDAPEQLEQIEPELKAELKETTERFQRTLSENERALRAAKQATDSLLKAFISAAEKQHRGSNGYSAGGREVPKRTDQAISVTLDQRF